MNTAKAEAEMAYGLQASKVQARIKEEEMQVERQQETNIIFIRSLSKSSKKMTHFFMEGRGRGREEGRDKERVNQKTEPSPGGEEKHFARRLFDRPSKPGDSFHFNTCLRSQHDKR